jgi:hypothetical protein
MSNGVLSTHHVRRQSNGGGRRLQRSVAVGWEAKQSHLDVEAL